MFGTQVQNVSVVGVFMAFLISAADTVFDDDEVLPPPVDGAHPVSRIAVVTAIAPSAVAVLRALLMASFGGGERTTRPSRPQPRARWLRVARGEWSLRPRRTCRRRGP